MNMTITNLIKLGAFAQKQFDMKDGFKILLFPADHEGPVRVAIVDDADISRGPVGRFAGYDEVQLIEIGTSDNHEYVRAGYSRATNTLCLAG